MSTHEPISEIDQDVSDTGVAETPAAAVWPGTEGDLDPIAEATNPPVSSLAGETVADPSEVPEQVATPVEAAERLTSVDVLRGVALLGILAMNIVSFAWPGSVYSIPIMAPDADWADQALWTLNHVLFDTKMMSLFSMLFGAGLVLMADRAEGRHARWRKIYYRRVTWLLIIGLIHSYLIWDGDILVLYACCGFLLYPFRKLRPRTLILVGLAMNLVLVPVFLGFRFIGIPYMKSTAERTAARVEQGEKPGWWDQKVHDAWEKMSKPERPKRENMLRAIFDMRGSYPAIVSDRAGSLIIGQTIGFLLGGWWLSGGRMLMGMGLMKLGVFGAGLPRRVYLWMAALGYGIGIPLMLFDSYHQIANEFFLSRRLWYVLDGWPLLNFYGSLPVVFGHIGAVMLFCQSGLFLELKRRIAAVGRMALSNYLFDSIVCTTLFYGYGFDFFGTLHRPMLYALVLAIWTFQILVSSMWLEHFRYGPAEWLWRSLTYWRWQPIRHHAAAPVGVAVSV